MGLFKKQAPQPSQPPQREKPDIIIPTKEKVFEFLKQNEKNPENRKNVSNNLDEHIASLRLQCVYKAHECIDNYPDTASLWYLAAIYLENNREWGNAFKNKSFTDYYYEYTSDTDALSGLITKFYICHDQLPPIEDFQREYQSYYKFLPQETKRLNEVVHRECSTLPIEYLSILLMINNEITITNETIDYAKEYINWFCEHVAQNDRNLLYALLSNYSGVSDIYISEPFSVEKIREICSTYHIALQDAKLYKFLLTVNRLNFSEIVSELFILLQKNPWANIRTYKYVQLLAKITSYIQEHDISTFPNETQQELKYIATGIATRAFFSSSRLLDVESDFLELAIYLVPSDAHIYFYGCWKVLFKDYERTRNATRILDFISRLQNEEKELYLLRRNISFNTNQFLDLIKQEYRESKNEDLLIERCNTPIAEGLPEIEKYLYNKILNDYNQNHDLFTLADKTARFNFHFALETKLHTVITQDAYSRFRETCDYKYFRLMYDYSMTTDEVMQAIIKVLRFLSCQHTKEAIENFAYIASGLYLGSSKSYAYGYKDEGSQWILKCTIRDKLNSLDSPPTINDPQQQYMIVHIMSTFEDDIEDLQSKSVQGRDSYMAYKFCVKGKNLGDKSCLQEYNLVQERAAELRLSLPSDKEAMAFKRNNKA